MEKCANCKVEYPSEILSVPFGFGNGKPICGICALALTNELHGINRTKFDGETAEDFRLDAIEWRKKHREV